ncbi:spore coat protein [Tumebacillus flagellatus]|uniref:Uncharacterized protein n=1 Tax=Tumebacillus flagellatus TaxID=1157490 RepID=A0A074MCV4_9BACL|nr:spore coat protein [Tumebacillus flagellatus]KEO83707.1 hypothetical protein EL26_08635 [Tumebacillus flagellatus]
MQTDDLANYMDLLPLADPTVAMDFLLTAKTGVRNLSIAVTEIGNPEAKAVVRKHLDQAVLLHEQISQLMMSKGWLHPYDPNTQFQLDQTSATAVLKIANLKLWPEKFERANPDMQA